MSNDHHIIRLPDHDRQTDTISIDGDGANRRIALTLPSASREFVIA